MSVSVSTTAGTQVTVTVDGATRLSFTTEESSISVVDGGTSSISVTNQGPKGDTGATGATGATGQGVPTGGSQYQLLRKVSGDDYDTEWDYADRVTLEVRFDEAVSKGDPLYITGYNSGLNRITVAKADASDSAKMPSIGLAFDDYSLNDNGQATTIGSLDHVNTQVAPNDFQEGDVLYVKAGGGLTNVKPTGTNLIQNVGKVGRRQQNNGEIVVMAIGRSNDVPNIPSGQAWIGNASGVATPTTLATVATSGSYNDLSDKPTIPTDTNLGNSDQTLSAERTVEMSANAIVFDNSSSEVARIFPQGYIRATGRSIINGNGAIGGQVVLNDADSSNGVTLQGPSTVGSNLTLTLPDADGSSGQVLKTNGSGVLSFGQAASRGGTYSYSGYATDVTKTATFYYQFPSATATSSSTDMISGFVGQAINHGSYGTGGSMTLDGLSSTDSATYSMTVKVTTNGTIIIGTVIPAGSQFVAANQIALSNPSEQTFTLTQTSPTSCLSEAGNQWVLGLQVTFFGATSVDFRVEDLSITVS